MPVRIYDISKKLGLENKEVLSKAKQLGLVAARVGKLVLDWLSSRWVRWVQVGAAVVIVAVGVVLTVNAWRTLSALV